MMLGLVDASVFFLLFGAAFGFTLGLTVERFCAWIEGTHHDGGGWFT